MTFDTRDSETLTITPGKTLHGDIGVGESLEMPGDKSLSHRAALFSALADGESQIQNYLISGVTQALLNGLTELGISWELQNRTLIVQGVGLGGLLNKNASGTPARINCDNSATTMRLLAGALAAWNRLAILDGSEGLRRRPMRRIVSPLMQMGVDIQAVDGCAPLTIQPVKLPLKSIEYTLPVASAQVKSCLLLAGLSADSLIMLREPGPSRDHTERMLLSMGALVRTETIQSETEDQVQYITSLSPPLSRRLDPLQMILPGDISAAAFLIVAALITPDSELILRGIGLNPTRTGLLDALTAMGADIQIFNRSEQAGEPVGDLFVRYSQLEGVSVRGELVVRMIDEFPVFAVAAAYANGRTKVRDALELRYKESDRIHALCQELSALGAKITEVQDGFDLDGGKPLAGGFVEPHGDHRLAMSMTVAGLAAESPVVIHNAQIIHESFPDFVAILKKLGGNVTVEQEP